MISEPQSSVVLGLEYHLFYNAEKVLSIQIGQAERDGILRALDELSD